MTADEFASQPAPAAGRKTLAVTGNVQELHIPPLEEGGDHVVITPDGTEVDEETAARAHEAAALAGVQLTEIGTES